MVIASCDFVNLIDVVSQSMITHNICGRGILILDTAGGVFFQGISRHYLSALQEFKDFNYPLFHVTQILERAKVSCRPE